MEVSVNIWAVLVAGLSSMVVGTLWYGPVFGKMWKKIVKLNDKRSRKEMPLVMGLTVVLSLAMAYVLAHVAVLSESFFGTSFMSACLSSALWLWLGMVLPAIATGGLFEQRRKKLILLNVFNMLVTLLVILEILATI